MIDSGLLVESVEDSRDFEIGPEVQQIFRDEALFAAGIRCVHPLIEDPSSPIVEIHGLAPLTEGPRIDSGGKAYHPRIIQGGGENSRYWFEFDDGLQPGASMHFRFVKDSKPL